MVAGAAIGEYRQLGCSRAYRTGHKGYYSKRSDAMTNSQRLGVCLIASALVAGCIVPASATELPILPNCKAVRATPPIRKIVTVAAVKKPARPHLIRIASAEPLPTSVCGLSCHIPIVLGVGY
jgi:hypothetical protein